MPTEPGTEFIKVEEFAERLRVSRSTVYNWMRSGELEPGTHFLRFGKTVRFLWGPHFLETFHQERRPACKAVGSPEEPQVKIGKATLNLDY